jgi:hypothetical protein
VPISFDVETTDVRDELTPEQGWVTSARSASGNCYRGRRTPDGVEVMSTLRPADRATFPPLELEATLAAPYFVPAPSAGSWYQPSSEPEPDESPVHVQVRMLNRHTGLVDMDAGPEDLQIQVRNPRRPDEVVTFDWSEVAVFLTAEPQLLASAESVRRSTALAGPIDFTDPSEQGRMLEQVRKRVIEGPVLV